MKYFFSNVHSSINISLQLDSLFQTTVHSPLVLVIEIPTKTIDVWIDPIRVSWLVFLFILGKSEAVIVKWSEEEVTCFPACGITARNRRWIQFAKRSFVTSWLDRSFFSLRVRNSKFLGLSRPKLLAIRIPTYRAAFSYSC